MKKIRNLEDFKKHDAYIYALNVTNNKIPVNKYVHMVCQEFIDELDNEDSEYYFDINSVNKISMMTQFINMPSGMKVGQTVGDSLAQFQWFFIVNALCWKMKDDHEKRRYEKSVLLIGRKSGKTFLTAVLFILLMLIEPKYSNFYSVAPDKELSSLILTEIKNQINESPLISKHFRLLSKKIECKINGNTFEPLATSNNRMDGRLAAVFVADEVGALANRYPIDSMESSQMNVKNRTGILISTAYESLNNPMTQEVDKAQNSLLKKEGSYDPALFSLLYKPDYPGKWMTSDDELLKANPLAAEISDNFEFIKKKRQSAINNPLERKNFLTKHMNIFINGEEAETFLSKDQVDKVAAKNPIDWKGREVYVGLDLSETNDNTSVAMVSYDQYENKFYTKAWAFYPKLKENYKSKVEKVEYSDMTEKGYSFSCGNAIIDYEFIENFVMDLESNYGVTIKGIGYDRWNARSSISKFSNEGFDCMEIKQTNEGLYPGTKLLKEAILSEHFLFDENFLLRTNLLNARTVTNTNMSYHLGKKQSDGKIDMAAAIVDSMALWNDEIDDNALRGNSSAITILGE